MAAFDIVRATQKPNYTANQNQVADWILLGHTAIRTDPTLRCYAIREGGQEGRPHHYYPFVKDYSKNPGGGFDNGLGEVTIFGTGIPGAPKITSTGVIIEGKVQDFRAKPSPICGLVVNVIGRGATGSQRLFARINFGKK